MKKKILIIEDEKSLAIALKKKLSDDFDLNIQNDTKGCIDYAVDADYILVDIILPGEFNGMEFLKQLRKDERTKNKGVSMITNLDVENKLEIIKDLNIDRYFIKASVALDEIYEFLKNKLPV